MRIFFLFWGCYLCNNIYSQQDCYLYKTYPAVSLSDEAAKLYNEKLQAAQAEYNKDSSSADAIIWLGRRTAYAGNYKEAIAIFTKGLQLHPNDARMYRHRGHRYLTLRCFDAAIADFKKATVLIKGKPDEIEPDGLPNAKNTPTSTLQSNIWYHLGLAYFIKGEYKKALTAYDACLRVSKNPDMYVATANWLYITLRRLQKNKQAAKLLASITPDMELIENEDYHKILMLYKNPQQADEKIGIWAAEKNTLSQASFGYGISVFLLNTNKTEEAKIILKKIANSNQWAAFGYIAAEAELIRL